MAFTFVTGGITGQPNGVSPSAPIALHQTPGAGHLLVIEVCWQNGGTAAVSDPNNGTWTPVGSPLTGVGTLSTFKAQFFYVASCVGAATTVTVTITGGVSSSLILFEVIEYSYTGGALALDGTAVNNATAVASVATTSSISTSGSSDLVLAAVFAVDSGASAKSPYTLRDDTINTYNAQTGALWEERTGVAAGSQSATVGTGGATDNTILGIIAFTAGAAGDVISTENRFQLAIQ